MPVQVWPAVPFFFGWVELPVVGVVAYYRLFFVVNVGKLFVIYQVFFIGMVDGFFISFFYWIVGLQVWFCKYVFESNEKLVYKI